jgi:8-oxo-dGTP diphosphatase
MRWPTAQPLSFVAVTIYLVRHAQAGSRHDWTGDDFHRPLSAKGRRQVAGLVEAFGDRPITRVLSSPLVRCIQTVEPIAQRHGIEVEPSDLMAERAPTAKALALIRSLAGTEAMLCSHGDVIPAVISAMASDGVRVHGRRSAAKGGAYIIEVNDGDLVSATYLNPPDR